MTEAKACHLCQEGYFSYEGSTKCSKCPNGSIPLAYKTYCGCSGGKFWNIWKRNCDRCPENQWSSENQTVCSVCPPNSVSVSGSQICNCTSGFYMTETKACQQCQDGYFSYEGSTECSKCPNGSLSLSHKAYCGCKSGKFWNISKSDCNLCPTNHWSSENQTECTECQKSYPSFEDNGCNSSEQNNDSISITAIIVMVASILVLVMTIIGVYIFRAKIYEASPLLRTLLNKFQVQEVEAAEMERKDVNSVSCGPSTSAKEK